MYRRELKRILEHNLRYLNLLERPVVVTDDPLGGAEPSYPETLHVQDAARVDNESAFITLCNWTQLVAEQNRWRLFHWNIEVHQLEINIEIYPSISWFYKVYKMF